MKQETPYEAYRKKLDELTEQMPTIGISARMLIIPICGLLSVLTIVCVFVFVRRMWK